MGCSASTLCSSRVLDNALAVSGPLPMAPEGGLGVSLSNFGAQGNMAPPTTASSRDAMASAHSSPLYTASFRPDVVSASLLPFVPLRVISDILSSASAGRGSRRRTSAWSSAGGGGGGGRFQGAALMVDVSGFTRLSEAYGKLGTAGCEKFALIVTEFFSKLTAVLADYGGDIDCFAGDAVLVVFRSDSARDDGSVGVSRTSRDRSSTRLSSGSAGHVTVSESLGGLTSRAICCAEAVTQKLSGFQKSPGDPALQVHSALASGVLYSGVCGSTVSWRSEAFLVGEPLWDLGRAMPLSAMSELVLAPSARMAVGALLPPELEAEERGEGFLCLKIRPGEEPTLASVLTPRRSSTSRPASIDAGILERSLVRLREDVAQKKSNRISIGGKSMSTDGFSREAHLPYSAQVLSEYPALKELVRFVPEFIVQRLLQGDGLNKQGADAFAEHRSISVLFIVGRFQSGLQPEFINADWVMELESVLGKAIDVAEGHCGGATRQITVDDKGVAAIFVFGLPGFTHHSHPASCAVAAHKVLEVLNCAHLEFSAGLGTGMAFCGIIGDPDQRCEFSVMGDIVNIAARLGWYAGKEGHKVACTANYKAVLLAESEYSGISFRDAGTIKLKGKEKETSVCAVEKTSWNPKLVMQRRFTYENELRTSAGTADVRQAELAELTKFFDGDFNMDGDRIMVIESSDGMGGSQLMSSLIRHVQRRKYMATDGSTETILVIAIQVQHFLNQTLQFCNDVMLQILNATGFSSSSELFSKLEKIPTQSLLSPERLPKFLQPHAKRLLQVSVQRDEAKKMRMLLSTYAKIFRDILSSRRCLLALDDLQYMHSQSTRLLLQVLSAPVARSFNIISPKSLSADVRAMGHVEHRYNVVIVGCNNTSSGNQTQNSWLPNSSDLRGHTGIFRMKLEALNDLAIAQLAASVFQCSSITPELSKFLSEHAKGLPLHAREICRWLQNQGFLEGAESGIVGLRESYWRTKRVPPSVQNLVQSQIDQLPPGLAIILKCASVIGIRFPSTLLLCLLQSMSPYSSTSSLQQRLETLEQLQFIQPVTAGEKQELVDDVMFLHWQFWTEVKQQVVYNNMLHKHKLRLHRVVIEWLGNQPPVTGEEKAEWLLQKMSQHVLLVKAQTVVPIFDLIAASEAVQDVADWSMASGHPEEAVIYQDMRLKLIDEAAADESKDKLKIAALQHALQSIGSALFFDSSSDFSSASNIQNTNKQRFKDLMAQLQQLEIAEQDSKREAEISNTKRGFKSLPGTRPSSFHEKIEDQKKMLQIAARINTKIVKFVVEAKQNVHLPKASVDKFLRMCTKESSNVGKALLASHFVTLLPQQNAAFIRQGLEEAYKTYLTEIRGVDPHLTTIPGIVISGVLAACGLGFETRAGNIACKKWKARFSLELSALAESGEIMQVWLTVCTLQDTLGIVSPYCSPEQMGLAAVQKAQLDKVPDLQIPKPWLLTFEAHTMMNDIGAKSEALDRQWHELLLHDQARDISQLQLEAQLAKIRKRSVDWAQDLDATFNIGMKTASPTFVYGVVRLCIEQGWNMVWPTAMPGEGFLSCPLEVHPADAIEHLKQIVRIMAVAIEILEKNDCVTVDSVHLPATLAFVKGSLQLFQSNLRKHKKASSKSLDTADQDDLQESAYAAVCAAMVTSQSIALIPEADDRGELLSAAMPATVTLAMLLLGSKATGDSIAARCSLPSGPQPGETLYLPRSLPTASSKSADEAPFLQSFESGSAKAMQVALNHLKQILGQITVQDKPVVPQAVRSLVDVGGSTVVWRAAMLYNTIKRMATSATKPTSSLDAAAIPSFA